MIIKKATDNEINKINKRIITIVNKLGKNSDLYKQYIDYFTVHGITTNTSKKGIIQIKRGKKANLTDIQLQNIEQMDYVGKLQKELKKRGEKATVTAVEKAIYVKKNLDNIKEFVYLSTGERHINGLSDTKGKKTYAEMYSILKKYEKQFEEYKKQHYEDLEDF